MKIERICESNRSSDYRNYQVIPGLQSWPYLTLNSLEYCSEELYISSESHADSGVWSGFERSVVFQEYTCNNSIKNIVKCSFKRLDCEKSEEILCETALCSLRFPDSLSVHLLNGNTYEITLPFHADCIIPVSNGLFIQQADSGLEPTNEKEDERDPSMLSLSHPLDDPRPVIVKDTNFKEDMRKKQSQELILSQNEKIIKSIKEPPILVTFNIFSRRHTVWQITQETIKLQNIGSSDQTVEDGGSPEVPVTPANFRSSTSMESSLSLNWPRRSSMLGNSSNSSQLNSPGWGSDTSFTRGDALGGNRPLSFGGSNRSTHRDALKSALQLTGPSSLHRTEGEAWRSASVCSSRTGSPSPIEAGFTLRRIWEQPNEAEGPISAAFMCPSVNGTQDLLCLVENGTLQALSIMIEYTENSKETREEEEEQRAELLVAEEAFVLPCLSAVPLNVQPAHHDADYMNAYKGSLLLVLTPERKDLVLYRGDFALDVFDLPDECEASKLLAIEEGCGEMFTLVFRSNTSPDDTKLRRVRCRIQLMPFSPLMTAVFEALDTTLPETVALSLRADLLTISQKKRQFLLDQGSVDPDWDIFMSMVLYLLGFTGVDGEGENEPEISQITVHSLTPWEKLIGSAFHHEFELCNPDCFEPLPPEERQQQNNPLLTHMFSKYLTTKDLQLHFATFFGVMHLLYEDFQLDYLTQGWSVSVGNFLQRICAYAGDGFSDFSQHYRKGQPSPGQPEWTEQSFSSPCMQQRLFEKVPCFFSWAQHRLSSCTHEQATPCGAGELLYTSTCCDFPLLPAPACGTLSRVQNLYKVLSSHLTNQSPSEVVVEALVLEMAKNRFTQETLSRIPQGFALPFQEAIEVASLNAAPGWSAEAYKLVGRDDLALTAAEDGKQDAAAISRHMHPEFPNDENGFLLLEHKTRLRFAQDFRVHEVCRLLNSSKVVLLNVPRAPEATDHEHQQRLQSRLHLMCKRVVSISVGRGMLTMGTLQPLLADALPIPPLCLSGRVPPTQGGATVRLDISASPEEMTMWPQFHNGVAAGLRLEKGLLPITRTWIVYNRPAASADGQAAYSHGGLLMALGLQGHLTALSMSDIYDYLTQNQDSYLVGLLLGMACSKRGTADPKVSKMLCLYLPSLLPCADFEISAACQAAAIQGLGLLYIGTTNRLLTEFLLQEIARVPVSEHFQDREAYSLAASLSLGLINLGKGRNSGLVGLSDLKLEDRLYQFIKGGKNPLSKANQDQNEAGSSSRLWEGDQINTSLTATGALLSLGLIYLKSNNAGIAQLLQLPSTTYDLGAIRPDLLMYMIIAKALVLWDSVRPTKAWIEGLVPPVLQLAFDSGHTAAGSELDWQSVRQNHAYIMAGGCFAIGLRFAGSANAHAMETLLHHANRFKSMRDGSRNPRRPERSILEMCLGSVVLALGMVMSGTGDVACLKVMRELRAKVDTELTYGHHMCIGMALGLLFLGGGNYALARSDEAIAMLVISMFPRFPAHSQDNQYHLQALRHLYVLAVEERGLTTVDVLSGEQVFCPVKISLQGENKSMELVSPCFLPELHLIRAIEVVSPFYHSSFVNEKPWVRKIHIKQKSNSMAGPKETQTLSLKRLPRTHMYCIPELMEYFNKDTEIMQFIQYFCFEDNNTPNQNQPQVQDKAVTFERFCVRTLNECLACEKTQKLTSFLRILRTVSIIKEKPLGMHAMLGLQQVHHILKFYLKHPFYVSVEPSAHKPQAFTTSFLCQLLVSAVLSENL